MNSVEQNRLMEVMRDSLRSIVDPEIGENIVDLGLVYGVSVSEAGEAVVTMTTTMPGCPAAGYLRDAVAACLRRVDGITSVCVELTYLPPWSPDMIDAKRVDAVADGERRRD